MSSKHDNVAINYDKPYEENTIGMSGIIGFAVGLFLLIVITFGLMWILLAWMEETARPGLTQTTPLARTADEKLPPEPRLQGAPGFGVDGPKGRVNLELKIPQSEYRELMKIWEDEWQNGKSILNADGKTKTVVALPIEDAKKKFLESAPKTRATGAQEAFNEAQTFLSDASSGRSRTNRRR